MPDPLSNRRDRIAELVFQCVDAISRDDQAAVERVCALHPELADEIRAVLADLSSVGLLAEGTADAEDRRGPGDELGDFRLLRPLGSGGMGVVWLAEQKSLGRRVALKLLRGDLYRDRRSRERFRREITTLSRLDHPNLCTVYEAGEVDGTQYLAMRAIDGEGLDRVLARRRHERAAGGARRTTTSRDLTLDVQLVESVARALHTAHEAGVVHRDVKPGNILVDVTGEPALVDFGLARPENPDTTALTVGDAPLGTPAYMAPEQIHGRTPVDRRTDVYGLGATLYECLTLETPFDATVGQREQLYHRILTEPPLDPRQLNRAIGADLCCVLEKALDKDPARRFATALEFADELRRIRERQPIRTRRAGPLLRTWRWCQRNRAATVALVAISIALAASLFFLQRSVRDRALLSAQATLREADRVRPENPERAFELERGVIESLDRPPPDALAQVQATAFQLRRSTVLRDTGGARLHWARWSPDGDRVLVGGEGLPPMLLDRAGRELASWPADVGGHRDAAAFSPDGTQIALAAPTGTVCVHRITATGVTETHRFDGEGLEVWSVAFAPAGDRLLVAWSSPDRGIAATTWRLADRARQDLSLAGGAGAAAAFWPARFLDDRTIVAAGWLWRDAMPTRVLRADAPRVVVVDADGSYLAVGFADGEVWVWHHSGDRVAQLRRSPELAGAPVRSVEFRHDGQQLLVANMDGSMQLHRAPGFELVESWRSQDAGTVRASFAEHGRRVVSGNWRGRIEVWDPIDGLRTLILTGHTNGISWLEVSPHRPEEVVSTSWDGTARLWHLAPRTGVAVATGLSWPFVDAALGRVVLTSRDGEVRVCDASGGELRRFSVDGRLWAVSIGHDGRTAVIAEKSGRVFTIDLTATQDQLALREHPVRFEAANGKAWIATQLAGGAVVVSGEILDAPFVWVPGEDIRALRVPRGVAVAAHPDGQRFVVGTGGRHVLEYDRRGTLLREIETPSASILGLLNFSADGTRLLVPSQTGEAFVIDYASGRQLARFGGHQHTVIDAAFSPDERFLATASYDGQVFVQDLRNPSSPPLILPHPSSLTSIAFVTDDTVVTACRDGSARWWRITPEAVRTAMARIEIPPLRR